MNRLKYLLGESWFEILSPFFKTKQWKKICDFIIEERKKYNIIPEKGNNIMFKAFSLVAYDYVKIVIIGQDPYPTPGAFDGIPFSNSLQNVVQPSLKTILREINRDVYNNNTSKFADDKNLLRWTKQGILLLNTAHTVRAYNPGTHLEIWNPFTNFVISKLIERKNLIWLLWGAKAQKYEKDITNFSNHIILTAPHPSPRASKSFIGCSHFSKVNEILENNIEW